MMNPETLNLKFYSDFHLIAQAPLDRNINQFIHNFSSNFNFANNIDTINVPMLCT